MTYLLATTFAGSATAQSSVTSFASITGASFTPGTSECMVYTRNGYSGEFEDGDGCQFSGGIQLPHGALITGVWVFYEGGTGTSATLHLEENGPFSGHTDIAAFSLSDCGVSECVASSTHLTSPDVNNAHFGYAAWVSPDPGFTIYRVVVRYAAHPGAAGQAVSPTKLPKAGTAVNPSH
jgi:hypothetical protein